MEQRKKYKQKETFNTQDKALDFATFKVKKNKNNTKKPNINIV